MSRLLALTAVAVLACILAAAATGKVALRKAEACGSDGCRTLTADPTAGDPHSGAGALPFELFGPTIEAGRRAQPPAQEGDERIRVTFTTLRAPGPEVFSLDYFPQAGYLHILGEPGTEAGGAMLNTGWVRLTSHERAAYDSLVAGVTPFGAEPDDGGDGGTPAATIALLAGAVLATAAIIWALGGSPPARARARS